MEQAYYNTQNDLVNKKDRKRITIHSKISKIHENFYTDKDVHYRSTLQNLQAELSTIHQGNNERLRDKSRDFEEIRDYDLVQLRLWEEYQIGRAESDFYDDVEKANKEHDEMVKLVKEKLYANLEKQVKQLKEDKVLLDMANSHSYSMDANLTNVHEFHKNTRSTTSLKNSSISSIGYMSDRRGLRRRDYSTNNEDSHASANESGNNSNSKKRRAGGKYSSNEDTLVSDTGDLSSILFRENAEKPTTRHSSKAFSTPPGLKAEEVDEDLALLKSTST